MCVVGTSGKGWAPVDHDRVLKERLHDGDQALAAEAAVQQVVGEVLALLAVRDGEDELRGLRREDDAGKVKPENGGGGAASNPPKKQWKKKPGKVRKGEYGCNKKNYTLQCGAFASIESPSKRICQH